MPTVFDTDFFPAIVQFTVAVPTLVIGVVRLLQERMSQKESMIITRFLMAFYLGCLKAGSYLLPAF
nr:hypothetical protein [Candidatus Njordarchaeota archaeon]